MNQQLGHRRPNAPSPNPEAEPVSILVSPGTGPTELREDVVAREEPLEIRVRGRAVAVTMRSPGHDPELSAGFLVGEGLVRERREVVEIAEQRGGAPAALGNVVNVFLAPEVEVDFDRLTRRVYASSSCGLCGKASIEAIHQQFPPIHSAFTVDKRLLIGLPAKLRAAQRTFAATGGLHGAAVFDERGELLVAREDVGRHNAVDKAIGHLWLAGAVPLSRHILLVSGRASFEIVQKALAAHIPVVAAVSAPSSLAVTFARENGQALVAFLRGDSLNIYAHPERILED